MYTYIYILYVYLYILYTWVEYEQLFHPTAVWELESPKTFCRDGFCHCKAESVCVLI